MVPPSVQQLSQPETSRRLTPQQATTVAAARPTAVLVQPAPPAMQMHLRLRGPESRSFVPPPSHAACAQQWRQYAPMQPHQSMQPPSSQEQLQPQQVAQQPQEQADPMSATLQTLQQMQPSGAPPTTYGGHTQLLRPASAQGAPRRQVPVSVEVVAAGSSGTGAAASSVTSSSAPPVAARRHYVPPHCPNRVPTSASIEQIGRASCRERV